MAQKQDKPYVSRPILSATEAKQQTPVRFVFNKANYQLLALSVLIVAIGFILMSGTTNIYSNTKIVVAPLVVLAGFGLGFYAIMKKTAPEA